MLQEVTTDSITLVPIEGYEYSKDGIIWQNSNVFNNLTVATTYEIYQRVKATEEIDKSPKSDALEVTTKKYENSNSPYNPLLSNRTDTTITLLSYDGYEYSIDGESFQDSTTFSNLNPNTAYTFYQRIKETSDTYASVISNSEVFYTLKKENTTEPEEIQTEEITPTSITLVSIDGYEYSINNDVNFQDNNVFSGLTPNSEYTFYQRSKETEAFLAGSIATKIIKTIKYANNNSVDAPVLESYTANDVTLKKIDVLEYSKDQENWQDSNVFTDLTPETEYTFYQRIKETNDTYASSSSEGLSIITKKENTNIPVKPEIEDVTENIVTVKSVEGYEYSANGGLTWQESNVLKLEPLTEYNITQRIKSNNEYGYSIISNSVFVKTNQVLSRSNIPDGYIPIYSEEDIPKGIIEEIQYTTSEYEEVLNKLKLNYIFMNDVETIQTVSQPVINASFNGKIEGNGFSLKCGKRSFIGGNNGIIKNLRVDSGLGSNYGLIYNCVFNDNVVRNGTIGGIVSRNYGTINNCINEGTLNGEGKYGFDWVGGICCENYGTIENCINKGYLKSNYGLIGGIVVNNSGSISNCLNYGKLESNGGSIGGIVNTNAKQESQGDNEVVIIKNCSNYGIINSNSDLGGICVDNQETIENCSNLGKIGAYNNSPRVAGIASGNYGLINCCFNTGTIKSITGAAGGIVSSNISNKIANCFNTGKVEGNTAGGICDWNYNPCTIASCYNIGKIDGTIRSGRIAGYNNGGRISNCYYLSMNNSSNDEIGIGLLFSEMRQQESFVGFDFDTIWQIDPNADYYFPTLRGIENKTILPKNVEIETIKTNSITIKSIEGYEYSIDGENYQDSNVFDNLMPFTEYTIYQRIKKTETTEESISAYTSVKTLTYIGDINGDGKVNITDVALINAHVKKTKLLTGEDLEKADINGDGKVNITDVALVNAHVKKVKLLF